MNFSLEPPTILAGGSDRMDGLATSTRRAGQYVDTYPGSLQPSDGRLFSIALRNHEGVVRTMAANIGRSDTLLAAVGLNLHLAQGRYDATEQDNVVTVNDIFTQLGAAAPPDLGARGSSTAFGTSSPADAIPVPEAMEGIPEWVEMVVELGGNLVSFSYWAMKILEWTIGVNPLEQVVDFFIGDWKKVSECGSALTKVGEYWDAMSATIGDDCGYLFRGWQGDAAGSAEAYFARLISAFAEQRPALDQLGAQYGATAWGIYLAAKGVAARLRCGSPRGCHRRRHGLGRGRPGSPRHDRRPRGAPRQHPRGVGDGAHGPGAHGRGQLHPRGPDGRVPQHGSPGRADGDARCYLTTSGRSSSPSTRRARIPRSIPTSWLPTIPSQRSWDTTPRS